MIIVNGQKHTQIVVLELAHVLENNKRTRWSHSGRNVYHGLINSK